MHIKENSPVNFQVLGELFAREEDLLSIWKDAQYPLNIGQWLTRFQANGSEHYKSYLLKIGKEIIGHSALKIESKDLLHIELFFIRPEFRTKKNMTEVVAKFESYVKKRFSQTEISFEICAKEVALIEWLTSSGYVIYHENDQIVRLKRLIH